MYGYIRPLKGELKVREYENFRAVYCGLCHNLAQRYGFAARFVVNYDFTFLALLLHREVPCWQEKRCPANPLRKRGCLGACSALDTAADLSLILAVWKLRDTAADEGWKKALAARLSCACLHRAYRKAASRQGAFDVLVRTNLEEMRRLEGEKCPSLDRMADLFAAIVRQAAAGEPDGKRRRALEELFYHVGRIIYILDAVDDFGEDTARGRYNPLCYRYWLTDGPLPPDVRQSLRRTVEHSARLAGSAFQLLDGSFWTSILTNILYLGIPAAVEQVFAKDDPARQGTIASESFDKEKGLKGI